MVTQEFLPYGRNVPDSLHTLLSHDIWSGGNKPKFVTFRPPKSFSSSIKNI